MISSLTTWPIDSSHSSALVQTDRELSVYFTHDQCRLAWDCPNKDTATGFKPGKPWAEREREREAMAWLAGIRFILGFQLYKTFFFSLHLMGISGGGS